MILMRKTVIVTIGIIGVILFYFTFISAYNMFRSDWQLPRVIGKNEPQYRLVLITQELETPFWDKVGSGALEEAKRIGINLEVWGSYSKNQEDFLKKIEIAIESQVDGIIVQGLDAEEFKNLTKIRAAFYGIPIITVANDVPMEESLRRTYVGSDQYLSGQMIAEQLLADMGDTGNVILMGDSHHEYYQQQRLSGIKDVLKEYPNIIMEYAETLDTREQVTSTTRNLMNQFPNVDAFIAVNANIVGAMIQEIGKRSQVEPYYIYSFDDGPETMSLLTQKKIDGLIEQSPEKMGSLSVDLMHKWLIGEVVPLKIKGYLTDIRMLKVMEER